jgi:sulfur carrier protein
VRLAVNGKDFEAEPGLTIAGLLERLGVDGRRRVAVAVNGRLAPRGEHGSRRLEDGDRVEVIHPVAGG